MWGLPPPHPFSKKRHIGRSVGWAGMLPFSEDEPCSSPPGSHPWPSFLTRAYGSLPTSLFFSCPNASILAYVALPSCQTEVATGLRERGLLSTAQVQCGKNGEFDGVSSAWLYLFIYIVIVLYCYMLIFYIGIALFVYSVVCLFPYCMLEAWKYCFLYIYRTFGHIRYSIFRNCHFFRLLIMI